MGRVPKNTTLTGKHMVAIAKLGQGMKPADIARDMGFDVGTIYSWQKWPLFQERLASYVESIAKTELDRGLEDASVLLKEQISTFDIPSPLCLNMGQTSPAPGHMSRHN